MNRRNWLKASAMLAGGFTFLSGAANAVIAKPISILSTKRKRMTDELFAEEAEEPSLPQAARPSLRQ